MNTRMCYKLRVLSRKKFRIISARCVVVFRKIFIVLLSDCIFLGMNLAVQLQEALDSAEKLLQGPLYVQTDKNVYLERRRIA